MFNYLKKILFTLLILVMPYMNSVSKAMDKKYRIGETYDMGNGIYTTYVGRKLDSNGRPGGDVFTSAPRHSSDYYSSILSPGVSPGELTYTGTRSTYGTSEPNKFKRNNLTQNSTKKETPDEYRARHERNQIKHNKLKTYQPSEYEKKYKAKSVQNDTKSVKSNPKIRRIGSKVNRRKVKQINEILERNQDF